MFAFLQYSGCLAIYFYVFLCSSGTASASVVEKSLREEQRKRAEAERRLQLLEQRVAG